MKKLIVISVAALMALAAVGCRYDVYPSYIEAAWTAVEKIEQVHEQQFEKPGVTVQSSSDSLMVCFPSVSYPEEEICVTVEKDEKGKYSANWESIYVKFAGGEVSQIKSRAYSKAIGEKREEFQNANITVTADDVRAFGCGAEIGSSEYKAAAAAIYGEKLAECYRGSLTEDSLFYCYDIRCVGTEPNKDYPDSYDILIGFRVRDILPFSHLFGYETRFDSGAIHTDYEGWLVYWRQINVTLDNDGSLGLND